MIERLPIPARRSINALPNYRYRLIHQDQSCLLCCIYTFQAVRFADALEAVLFHSLVALQLGSKWVVPSMEKLLSSGLRSCSNLIVLL